ncbi:MAG TPA: amino acid permease [Candidatus Dormibacteraeota bacterium]|nr:amino acid permease [Candidatus Dormibacteraeota bacterium]
MQRAIDLRGAVALNVITMIGIGPLVTIPLVISALGGPLALLGWIGGAVVALCDGLVWAELASRVPGSGGTYAYLREAYGPQRLGRALAFLFNWQFLLAAPCLLASGYIGFANYAAYLVPAIGASWWLHDAVALAVGLATIALLYRKTRRVAITGIVLAVAAISTLAFIIVAALPHAHLATVFHLDAPLHIGTGLLAGFGTALYITLYDYSGYSDVALLGDEVVNPHRTIPRSILLSVLIVAALYVALQIGVLGVIPWRSLLDAHGQPTAQAMYVGALVVERTWGVLAARICTVLVLVTAFASLYGNLLGFSRIPYAAACEGTFLPYFAKLHASKDFPHRALLAVGALSLVASFFSLDQVIAFLTAGIVLIQSIAQIFGLALLRRRDPAAPFRMPLYPLPSLVALAGWSLALWYTGFTALALGMGWLTIGILAYVLLARTQRAWPFVAGLLLALLVVPLHARAASGGWQTWHTSAIVQQGGTPEFQVDGKPFFVYGAAFFYERTPRSQWRSDLLAYKAMGINTIDLYLIWNWHEPNRHTIDFTGKTDPRRNLPALFSIIHGLGLKAIVRPGPVIRNEWRNGGYPAWLLEQPAYDMPLHDILQGRYPATATLQNAHADAAAAEWLRNGTHLRAAAAWLHLVLHEIAPWSHDVIAVALDDDQGAYIDNDTWPAPHWHAYMSWLKTTVQQTVGTHVPLFINTYQMKVTASAPVWAWGNWYQSDAYRIGDHDLAQLAFSTGLLQTQSRRPVMTSEFQAGWLQGADEIAPRPAAPENTTLALHQMLQQGAHGVVNFPVQDTLDPPGWEAPWANWSYAWDAALTRAGKPSPRYAPTAAFGHLVQRYGTYLASLRPRSDASIAWLTSAYESALMNNQRVAELAALTIASQQRCRALALTCRLVDLRYDSLRDLLRTHVLIVPATGFPLRFTPRVVALLRAFRERGGIVVANANDALAAGARSSTGGITDASLLLSPDGRSGILDVMNPGTAVRTSAATAIDLAGRRIAIPSMSVPEGGAVDLRIRADGTVAQLQAESASPVTPAPIAPTWRTVPNGHAVAYRADVLADGTRDDVLDNGIVRVVVAPGAGARAFVFTHDGSGKNAFTTIGAFRDDVQTPATPSPRDYIARYTHPLEAGTFNRAYRCALDAADPTRALLRCDYTAPDLGSAGVRFHKTYELAAGSHTLVVTLEASAPGRSLSAFALPSLLTVTWPTGTQQSSLERRGYRLDRLDYPADTPVRIELRLQGASGGGANRR